MVDQLKIGLSKDQMNIMQMIAHKLTELGLNSEIHEKAH